MKEESFENLPLEWIEICQKLVNRDMNGVIEMKKMTLEDLKEVIKMHKLLSSYCENLIYFNGLLKEEIIRRTVRPEDKESVVLGQVSEDIFKEEQSNVLRSNELPKPSCDETEISKSSMKNQPEIEPKQVVAKNEPIEVVQPNLPTAIEIEMLKLKELPVEAVLWLRLNPMLAKKAMCHLNPDLKPSFVGHNVVDLGWVKNLKDARIGSSQILKMDLAPIENRKIFVFLYLHTFFLFFFYRKLKKSNTLLNTPIISLVLIIWGFSNEIY